MKFKDVEIRVGDSIQVKGNAPWLPVLASSSVNVATLDNLEKHLITWFPTEIFAHRKSTLLEDVKGGGRNWEVEWGKGGTKMWSKEHRRDFCEATIKLCLRQIQHLDEQEAKK